MEFSNCPRHFEEHTAEAILKLDWPLTPKEDKLCWIGTGTCSFSVGKCYKKGQI